MYAAIIIIDYSQRPEQQRAHGHSFDVSLTVPPAADVVSIVCTVHVRVTQWLSMANFNSLTDVPSSLFANASALTDMCVSIGLVLLHSYHQRDDIQLDHVDTGRAAGPHTAAAATPTVGQRIHFTARNSAQQDTVTCILVSIEHVV